MVVIRYRSEFAPACGDLRNRLPCPGRRSRREKIVGLRSIVSPVIAKRP